MAGRTRQTVLIVVAAAMAITGSACGSSKAADSQSAAPAESSTTTTRPPLTAAKVTSALLAIDDLPTGYSAAPPSSSKSSFVYCDSAEAAVPAVLKDASNPATSVSFTQSQLGPVISEVVGVMDTAPKEFDALKAALDSCIGTPWSTTDSKGAKTNYTLAPVSFPKLGDQSVAYRLTGTATGASVDGDLVIVRVNNAIALIGGFGTMSIMGSKPLDQDQFVATATKAVAKLSAS